MTLPIKFNLTMNVKGLTDAESILVRSVNNAFDALGTHLQRGVRSRVKYFVGREKRGVKYEVTGRGLSKSLYVFGELVQHFIDELGLPPGTFPPWGVGSALFRWASKKTQLTSIQQRDGSTARRRARRISHVKTRQPKSARRASGTVSPVRTGSGSPARTRPRIAGLRTRGGKRAAKTRSNRSERSVRRERNVRRLAFLAARAIYERGIRAGQPFGKTLEANRAKIVRDVENAFRRAIVAINRG
jgi:hypothetical protein